MPAAPRPFSARFTLRRGRPDGKPGAWVWLAAWGPCGLSPVAPGTVGTLGAVPLFWLLRPLPLWLYLVTLAAFVALAIRAAEAAGAYWKTADASPIVIDEVAGYLVTMALVPWSPGGALLGFLLFRVHDVLKPWPASALDRWKTGAGVVADDLAAGVWAAATYAAAVHLLRAFAGCHPATAFWCLELLP
ncbi:MAG: phosphatidylglycerophosphatase A [Deltaproteobacteria bacterium]|nr:phosphatidylglycerophosphatase A [Deltaproteobacteria bacterium]